MSLIFKSHELTELMQNFYTLTGIRLVLFDETYKEICSYPKECTPFCAHLRKNPEFYNLCCESDSRAFKMCKSSMRFNVYRCHAGLIECSAPIIDGGAVLGYIMFGQVSDEKNKEAFRKKLLEISKKYLSDADSADILQAISKIRFKSAKQLFAASKILETCTSHILLKQLVKPSRMKLFTAIDNYINEHLSEEITVDILCKKFNISRTRLYELIKPYISGGIAAYIKEKRLARAKQLILTTDMPISQISDAAGFSDYNYFLREFKHTYNVSVKKMRKTNNDGE